MYLAHTLPFKSVFANFKSIITEIIHMIIVYHVLLFTDFVIDPATKFSIGYSQLFWIALLAVLNLIIISCKLV